MGPGWRNHGFVQPFPNIPRLARVPLIGLGGMAKLKIVHDGRLFLNKCFLPLTRYMEFQSKDQNNPPLNHMPGFWDN